MGRRDQSSLNINEWPLVQMLPPSLSPAPRSHAEVLTSNHKSAVSMITPTQHHQGPEQRQQTMHANNHGRSPLQTLEASVTGMPPQLKRPSKNPQTSQEQVAQQAAQ